jgi:pSer/pThr/pTyr-binding forkhead associated (FHA) protein
MASILVMSGSQRGEYYPLAKGPNVIGRAEANPIQIRDDRISRKHLQIYHDEGRGRYCAFDMKSRHGVFVNSKKISDEIVLADGDEILVGDTILLFTVKDFPDRESALSHFKKVGERRRSTLMG